MNKIKEFIQKKIILFLFEHKHMFKEIRKNHCKQINSALNSNKESLPIDDKDNWVKKFNKLTYSYPELIDVALEFAKADIKIIRDISVEKNDIIAICVEKNDLIKIKKFITHHRKLGIDKFVIIDNDSNDGTIEWLKEQKDVIIMQTKTPYTTNRREAWINRVIAYYGYNRWYFVADSDELLDYNESEKKSINDLIKYYEKNNIVRARALMIDMYAKPEYYSNGNKNDFFSKCIYFDKDTYFASKRHHIDLICGGPRARMFDDKAWLTKYPLFYFRKKDIECKSHFLFPYQDNIFTKCQLVLKHYKFQPGDLEKYKDIIKKGNYFNGSVQYKKYVNVMEKNNSLDFIYENIIKYDNSKSLNVIDVYEPIV